MLIWKQNTSPYNNCPAFVVCIGDLIGYVERNSGDGMGTVGPTVELLSWAPLWASSAALHSSPSAWSLAQAYFHNTFNIVLCFSGP